MSDATPTDAPRLTPERMEAMLARTAEVCMAGVEEAGARMAAAPDIAEFERAGRTLNAVARGLRQTLALKLRFDREQAALTALRRREAEGEREVAEQARNAAITRHRMRVRRHFQQLWTEYEHADADEVFEDFDEHLVQLSREDETFLDTPVETLIERLAEVFLVPPHEDQPPEDAARAPAPIAEPATPLAEPEAAAPPEPLPPPEPAPRPPDPPPDPLYLPPWERVRPGTSIPGGSGW